MSRPWMPLYVADYLADTAHLSATESGAYLHLIMHYWTTGALPDDPKKLANISKTSAHLWNKICPTLQKFFHDGWKHKRVEAELAKASAISGKRRDAANSRHAIKDAKAPAFAEQLHTHARASSQPQSQEEDPEPTGSDAGASSVKTLNLEPLKPAEPTFTDSKHELWAEGPAILETLGVRQRTSRPVIGRWMKDAKDDAVTVLSAIKRARDQRVQDPISWITRAISTGPPRQRVQSIYEVTAELKNGRDHDQRPDDEAEFEFPGIAAARAGP